MQKTSLYQSPIRQTMVRLLDPGSIFSRQGLTEPFNSKASRSECQTQKTGSSKTWIVNPVLDMLFVCGEMLWLLVTFANLNPSLFASKTAPLFMLITQIGAVFFLDAHNGATILRICNEKELREKHKILWLWGPLVLAALFC